MHIRTYGNPPYNNFVIHGGPGACGEMEPVARELSDTFGVIEPLQTKKTINELVAELNDAVERSEGEPINLIGFSWGTWLSLIYAAAYPDKVKKLILIGSGPLEEKYAAGIMETRLSRLTEEDRSLLDHLQKKLFEADETHNADIMLQFGRLISKADTFDPIAVDEDIELDYEAYQRVWGEASKLRVNGELLRSGSLLSCPVTVIHGNYDPHPFEGAIEPLSRAVPDLKSYILNQCGHSPWKERNCRDRFFEILREEIQDTGVR